MRTHPLPVRAIGAALAALALAPATATATARAPQALTPAQLHAAYALPAAGARGQTIAVVSAYDDPAAASDLAGYSKRFRLPPCTVAARCLSVLNERGRSAPLPPRDPTGGQFVTESAVGIELAHGVCQSCRIILMEASSPSNYDLAPAFDAAARAGATVAVTSIDPIESQTDASFAYAFEHPRTAVVAAAGDGESGAYGFTGDVHFPATLPNVLGVGGTQLQLSRSGGYGREAAWAGTVSGCSSVSPAPAWQALDASAATCGSMRAVADVAAVADPGAQVRVSGAGVPGGPWFAATGTSVAAPIVAGVIGLAGSAGSGEAQLLYNRVASDLGALHDIRAGANSPYCGNRICKAGPGYDGPTGLGTPFGLEAFLPGGPALSPRHPRLSLPVPRAGVAVSRRWLLRVPLANANAFRVSGSLVVRRTLRLGGRLQTITFGAASFRLGPLATGAVTITVDRRYRSLLPATVYAWLSARGAAGRAATVTRALPLRAA